MEDEDIIYRLVKGFDLPFEMQKMSSVSGKSCRSWKVARVRAWGCFLSPPRSAARACQPTPCTESFCREEGFWWLGWCQVLLLGREMEGARGLCFSFLSASCSILSPRFLSACGSDSLRYGVIHNLSSSFLSCHYHLRCSDSTVWFFFSFFSVFFFLFFPLTPYPVWWRSYFTLIRTTQEFYSSTRW